MKTKKIRLLLGPTVMYHKNKISITDKTLCTPITKTFKKPSIKLNNVIDNKL